MLQIFKRRRLSTHVVKLRARTGPDPALGCGGLVARVIEADAGFAELQLSAQEAFPTLFEDPGRGRERTGVRLYVLGEDGNEMECHDGSWRAHARQRSAGRHCVAASQRERTRTVMRLCVAAVLRRRASLRREACLRPTSALAGYATSLSGQLFGCVHQLLRMWTLLDSLQRTTYALWPYRAVGSLVRVQPAPL